MTVAEIRVHVVFAPAPGTWDARVVQLPQGSLLADAIRASGLLERHPQAASLPMGVWGRKQSADAPLRDGDRVEVYRPLLCDPKEARRLRYRQRADKAQAVQAGATGGPEARDIKPST